ncbi:MAG: DNA polymerase III subunit delta [Campylobacteraceae bacterium]|nr:DNA polymerase III subunit delta [Campylobacteraceae bacterium]
MYKRELENLLQQKNLPKSILLYGVCSYQNTYFGELILDAWEVEKEDILTFYFDEYEFESAKKHLSQNSLFGNKNIAIIKTTKNIPKKDLDILVGICQKNANSYLLVQCFADEKNTKNMTKSFTKKQNGDFVRFFKLNIKEALSILGLQARKLKLNIGDVALSHLYLTHNEELSLAVNELSKLSILNKEIQVSDIDALVFGLGEINLGDFISDIVEKKDIKKQYENLIQSGNYQEVFIINALQNYVSELFAFHSYIKLHGNFNALDILGYPLPPQLASKRATQATRIKIPTFQAILQVLANAEYTLKQGTFKDKDVFILSTILEVQSKLV